MSVYTEYCVLAHMALNYSDILHEEWIFSVFHVSRIESLRAAFNEATCLLRCDQIPLYCSDMFALPVRDVRESFSQVYILLKTVWIFSVFYVSLPLHGCRLMATFDEANCVLIKYHFGIVIRSPFQLSILEHRTNLHKYMLVQAHFQCFLCFFRRIFWWLPPWSEPSAC